MELIPTKLKYKLPKGFSYPVGAQEISEALKSVPQYSKMSITFHDRDTFWASKFKERIKSKSIIKVIEIEYYRRKGNIYSPKHFIESDYYQPNWQINVYAVPKEYRHDTNQSIINVAMPSYRKWLASIGNTEDFTLHRKSYGIELDTDSLVEMK